MIRGGAVTLGAVAGGAFVPGATAQAAVKIRTVASATETVDGALVAPFGRHLAYGNDPRTEITELGTPRGLANDALILAQAPAFHLHAGDIAYGDPAGRGKTSDTGFDARAWDQFLYQTESVAKQVPWMPAYGNHDMEAWYSPGGYGGEEARWTLPDNGPDRKNLPAAPRPSGLRPS